MSIDSELHGQPDGLCKQLNVAIAVSYISEKWSLSISAFFTLGRERLLKSSLQLA